MDDIIGESKGTRTFKVIGPPGTGKTTYITKQVQRALHKYNGPDIMILSFTKTAAVEISSRVKGIPEHNVGTLHSMAYRSLDHPLIAHSMLGDWNKTYPDLAIKPSAASMDDGAFEVVSGGGGDRLLAAVDSLRNRMIDEPLWPTDVKRFYKRWVDWKAGNDCDDFTDLISRAIQEVPKAPGSPKVLFVDEAQDISLLESTLIKSWAKNAETTVVVGDLDQLIFSFRGCTVDSFMNWECEETKVLSQSWRVPSAPHRLAVDWIKRSDKREEAEYMPREDATGVVELAKGVSWKKPRKLVDIIEQSLEQHDGDVMFLASCGYMLEPTIAQLRERGIPFHNPYRPTMGRWSPLAKRKGVRIGDRLLAYLRPDVEVWGELARMYTAKDLHDFTKPLRAKGILKRGAKTRISELKDVSNRELEFTPNQDGVLSFFEEPVWDKLAKPDIDWWFENLLAADRKRAEYPVRIAKMRGMAALTETPRVVVGTAHSSKGSEAEHVIVAPDLSLEGFQNWRRVGQPRDGIFRLFYVAVTRTKNRLTILPKAGAASCDLDMFVVRYLT